MFLAMVLWVGNAQAQVPGNCSPSFNCGFSNINTSTIAAGSMGVGTIGVGTINAGTINATAGGTGSISTATVSATIGKIGSIKSTTIDNTGSTTTGSLAIGAGGVSVSSGAPISMGGNRVENVATPVAGTDAVNKDYVDNGDAANKAYIDDGLDDINTQVNAGLDDINTQVNAGLNSANARTNEAFRKIDENTEGIAVAIAMGGLAMPSDKTFAVGMNLGFYDGKEAVAAQTTVRLNDVLTLNGGLGVGFASNQVGGRVGVMAAW